MRASAGALAVHTALIPRVCVCVRYQTPFSLRHESGPSLFLSTGKHLLGGQLPRVFFSALPGQSSDRPNLPPHQKTFDFQFPFASIRRAPSEACSGQGKRRIDRSTSKRSSKKLQRATITAFFLDRSLVVVHCDRSGPVDDRHESENNACAYCMPVDLLPVLAVDLLVQQATACGLPEVFHVSPRSRSIAHVDLRPWCEQYASDRSEVFRLQANDVTWPGVACVCKSMKLSVHSV